VVVVDVDVVAVEPAPEPVIPVPSTVEPVEPVPESGEPAPVLAVVVVLDVEPESLVEVLDVVLVLTLPDAGAVEVLEVVVEPELGVGEELVLAVPDDAGFVLAPEDVVEEEDPAGELAVPLVVEVEPVELLEELADELAVPPGDAGLVVAEDDELFVDEVEAALELLDPAGAVATLDAPFVALEAGGEVCVLVLVLMLVLVPEVLLVVDPDPFDAEDPALSEGSIETVHHCVVEIGVAAPVEPPPPVFEPPVFELALLAGGVELVLVAAGAEGCTVIVGCTLIVGCTEIMGAEVGWEACDAANNSARSRCS